MPFYPSVSHPIFGLSLLAVMFLTACPPQPVSNTPAPPRSSAEPGTSPDPAHPPSPAASQTPPPGASGLPPQASPGPGTAGSVPAGLSRIRFGSIERFLYHQNAETQLQIELLDRLGQVIPVQVPLEWSSSRPQDFAVDAEGRIRALVAFGYSTITARIPGSDFEARTVVNVNSASGGGGGGSGGGGGTAAPAPNQPPVIQSLEASHSDVLGAGVWVRLIASATDADSTLTAASYSWSCAEPACADQFNTSQGPTVYWRSPATAGSFSLQVTVSDGKSSVSQDVNVSVQTGQGQVMVNPQPN